MGVIGLLSSNSVFKGRRLLRPLLGVKMPVNRKTTKANRRTEVPKELLAEENRRRQHILGRLLLGLIGVSLMAFITTVVNSAVLKQQYIGVPPWLMLAGFLTFVGFYLGRRRFSKLTAHLFIGLLFILGTIPLSVWGITLAEGLLMYVLAIVMAGILISGRFAVVVSVVVGVTLMVIARLQLTNVIHPNTTWLQHSITYADPIMFTISFGVVALVTWLSNREVEKSLRRAYASEAALRDERNSLEVKVVERTRQLEQTQLEQMLQLQRFAEFGRLGSGLVHDLANPLTAASLNLEQVDKDGRSDAIEQTRNSLRYMEQYVEAIRKQLQNRSETKWFAIAKEMRQVLEVLDYRAHQAGVEVTLEIDDGVKLHGDPVRFSQVMANLVANAIDAYSGSRKQHRQVLVRAQAATDEVTLVVRDWGMGIPPTDLAQVFEPFYSTKQSDRGIGIGLMMTKQIVEELGGAIAVSSSRAAGTRFTVTFPVEADERAGSTAGD
jgi:signal transduction histidine kinase